MIKRNDHQAQYRECQKAIAKHPVQTESKRIIVAFADIAGFGPWIKRAHALSDFHFLITQFYRKLIFLRNDLGYYLKFLADGGMIVREMGPGHNCGMAIRFLQDMNCLNSYAIHLIQKTHWPRPTGFRIRLAAGHVSKFQTKMCAKDCTFQKDYIGYPVNLASRTLRIMKESVPLLCHESVKDIIGPRKAKMANLHFKKIPKPRQSPDGVDTEDLNHLWEFYFNGES